jgi:hypothetical protein
LDFLGFPWIPSTESRLIKGYKRFSLNDLSTWFIPSEGCEETRAYDLGVRRRRIVHGSKLNLISGFLQSIVVDINCCRMFPRAFITITVDGPASAVMAGLVPAIHAVRLRHRFTDPDKLLSTIT